MPYDLEAFRASPSAFRDSLLIQTARGILPFGEVQATFQRERFAQLDRALIAVASGDKPLIGRHWWEATKGASKDSDLAACLVWLILFSPRLLCCQVGAADQDQADELRKAAKSIVSLNPWLGEMLDIQIDAIVNVRTESRVEIIAADVAGSHGARPDVLVLNELSHVVKREFAENLMDNAAKVPHGLVVIATNAGFKGMWQEEWRTIAETSPGRWFFHKFAEPAPWLDPAEIEEARQRNGLSRFMRLWHGVWSSGGGDALDEDDIEAAIRLPGPPDPDRRLDYVCSIDLGIKRDRSGLVVLGIDCKAGELSLAHCRSWTPRKSAGGEVQVDDVRVECLRIHKVYRPRVFILDPHQAIYLKQLLEKERLRCEEYAFSGSNLNEMAAAVLDVFRNRRIALYDDATLVADLTKLSIAEKAYGQRIDAPRTKEGHADVAIALCMAIPRAVALLEAGSQRLRIKGLPVGHRFSHVNHELRQRYPHHFPQPRFGPV